jgi:hypothetical protein
MCVEGAAVDLPKADEKRRIKADHSKMQLAEANNGIVTLESHIARSHDAAPDMHLTCDGIIADPVGDQHFLCGKYVVMC